MNIMSGIFEKLETTRAESIPFGPLTREDFNFLNRPFMFPGVEKVARERGMVPAGSLKDILKMLGHPAPALPVFRGSDFDAPPTDKTSGFYEQRDKLPLLNSLAPGKLGKIDPSAIQDLTGTDRERIVILESHRPQLPPESPDGGAIREIFPEGFRKPQ